MSDRDRVTRAFLVLPDLEAVAAAERSVGGMPVLMRTICSLRDEGVGEVVVAAPAGRQPQIDADDPRLRRDAPDPGEDGAALVLRGDLVYLPDAVSAMAAAAPGTAVTGRVGGEWRAVACVVAGAAGPASCAAVAQRGLDAVVARRPVGGPLLALLHESILPADTPAAARAAERRLLATLRKPTDGFFSRTINRRISLFLTSLLMNTGVHPNQVSLFTLVLGIVAGIVCACGGWLAAVIGAVCLEAHSIVDGVDGELARLKHLRSKLGAVLDTVSDDLAITSFMAGLAVNLWRAGATWALVVGVLAVLASLTGRAVVYWLLACVYHTGDQLQLAWRFSSPEGERGLRRVGSAVLAVLRALIKRDCFATVFVLLALVGRADVILLLCAAFAVGYLVALAVQLQHLRAGREAAVAAPPIPGPTRDPRAERLPRPVRRAPTLEGAAPPRAA